MKIIATLACRNNSSRLYGKPLQLLEKITVLDYIINRLKESGEISEIVLAISEAPGNEAFKSVASSHGISYVLGDDRDVLGRLIKACDLQDGDTVFRMTTESPFVYYEGIGRAVKAHADQQADYTTYTKLPDGTAFELLNLQALKTSHEKGEDRHRSELCTLYMNENRDRFKFNILSVEPAWERPDYRLTIDYPEDLIFVRRIIRHFGGDKMHIPYQDLIAFLDKSPELRALVENLTDKNYIKPYF
jgi:spore coat polysaccharide biosynthesis protein SpsF